MTIESSFKGRIKQRLDEIDRNDLKRHLYQPCGIDLSSNDFLSLSRHPLVKAQMAEAVLRDGAGSTASRLLRGHRKVFTDIENRFADFKGTERSLYFASGYVANIAVLSTLIEKDDLVLSDRLNHASIIDGLRLSGGERKIFDHCDVDHLGRLLDSTETIGQRFIVTESLFGMDGDKAPLREYVALCRETGAVLIVDEAHAVGLYGEGGSGLIEADALDHVNIISINPAGKALGVAGAFVAGPGWVIDYLVQRARTFIFSTAPPPSIASALTASLEIITNEPERRRQTLEIASYFRRALIANGFNVEASDSPIIPVVLGENDTATAVAGHLQAAGFDVRAIRPPTVPNGTARLRICVHYDLTKEVIDSFVSVLSQTISIVDGKLCFVVYS